MQHCKECARIDTCSTCKAAELDELPAAVKFSCYMFLAADGKDGDSNGQEARLEQRPEGN